MSKRYTKDMLNETFHTMFVFYVKVWNLKLCRVLGRLNLVRVSHAVLLAHFIHDLHDDNTFLQAFILALLSAFLERKCTLIGFPEHTVTLSLGVLILAEAIGKARSLARAGLDKLFLLYSTVGENELGLGRAVGRVEDLDFTLVALDADGWASAAFAVGVRGCAESGGSNAVGIATELRGTGEGDQHGGHFVGAGGVLLEGGNNGGCLACGFGLGEVEGLEDPSQGVDAQIEESASSQVGIDHAVRVFKGFLGLSANREVGKGAVNGANLRVSVFVICMRSWRIYLARSDDVADVDGQREVSRPHGLHQEQVLLLCLFRQLLCLGSIDGESLLAEDILASL